MDGLLIVDKPTGPTSHDIVAYGRRVLGERKVGHVGTLDPLASGVLPLVLGRATRLAQFLSAADKTYDASIQLGTASDTFDATGVLSAPSSPVRQVSLSEVEHVLQSFVGTYLQEPPAFSAKKTGGVPAYRLAREGRAVELKAVPVTVRSLDLVAFVDQRLTLRLVSSAGFYVRSLAHELGVRLENGAHLVALRRIRSGAFGVDEAVSIATLAEGDARRHVMGLDRVLLELPAFVLTPEGLHRIVHGRDVGSGHVVPDPLDPLPAYARLMDPFGQLIAIARPAPGAGALHPTVVLK